MRRPHASLQLLDRKNVDLQSLEYDHRGETAVGNADERAGDQRGRTTVRLGIGESTFRLHMSVSAHQSSEFSLDADAGGKGSASVGFGPFKASVEVSAHMSTHKENKRSSDYSSTMDLEIKMVQLDPPEGG